MSANNRRLRDKDSGTPTVIGEGSRFKGELEGSAAVIVLGKVEGQCQLEQLLTIEHGGEWSGNIKAQDVVVNGKVTGNIETAGKLEIGSQGHIQGNVSAGFIAIAQGAVIEGDMQMTGNREPVTFVEKRKKKA